MCLSLSISNIDLHYNTYTCTHYIVIILTFYNLAIRSKQYSVNDGDPLTFPQPGDLDNTTFTNGTVYVSIPPEVLSDRANGKCTVFKIRM